MNEPAIPLISWTLLHFLWQGTAIGLSAAIVLRFLRDASAQARYLFACAALALMLITPLLTAYTLAARLPFEGGAIRRTEVRMAIVRDGPLLDGNAALPLEPGRTPVADPALRLVVALWACGVWLLTIRLGHGLWRARQLHQHASAGPTSRWQEACDVIAARLHIHRHVRVVDVESVETPTLVGWLSPLIIAPTAALAGLTPAQVEAILAHELAHVRRHDYVVNLAQAVAETLLFYHPAVWWISHRVRAEREHCCDDVAVQMCGDPLTYATALTELEAFRSADLPLALGATSGSLSERVRRMLAASGRGSTDRVDTALAAVLIALLVAGTAATSRLVAAGAGMASPDQRVERVLIRWQRSPRNVDAPGPEHAERAPAAQALSYGQDVQIQIGGAAPPAAQAPAPQGPAAFEVASVKPNVSGTNNVRIGLQPGGRFTAVNVPARQLILFAYQVQNFQLIDAPDWTRDERFDIVAKAESDFGPTPLGQIGPVQMMVRSLLADRFKLVVRSEMRDMPMYALVLARTDGRLGPQLQKSSVDCAAEAAARGRGGRAAAPPQPPNPGERPRCGMFGGFGQIRAGGMRLGELARMLSNQTQRVVIDKTGLADTFDFDLTFTPDQMPQGAPPPGAPPLPAVDPNGPSIFTALQEQLGLKLEAERGPVPVLVVERIERPTPD